MMINLFFNGFFFGSVFCGRIWSVELGNIMSTYLAIYTTSIPDVALVRGLHDPYHLLPEPEKGHRIFGLEASLESREIRWKTWIWTCHMSIIFFSCGRETFLPSHHIQHRYSNFNILRRSTHMKTLCIWLLFLKPSILLQLYLQIWFWFHH